MARNNGSAGKSKTDDDLIEDDFEIDDSDSSLDAIDNIKPTDKLVTRRRLEDYFEEKRLREEMGDDFI